MATFTQMDEQELQFHPSHTYPQHENTESNGSKSPLQGFGGFFKSLSSSDKKVKADGQPPKRRGPKPDSKPAMTRRQELNRQAQRTHRERKEMYIKALEQEIYRLKELYQTTSRERDAYASENRKLRELLQQYGIPVPPPSSHTPATAGASGVGVGHPELGSSGSISGSYPPASSETHSRSPPIPNGTGPSPISASQGHGPGMGNLTAMLPGAGGIDYATVGVDFVTTLERPCMDHMQMLMVKSASSPSSDPCISGHALMSTAPPSSHIADHPTEPYPHKPPPPGMGNSMHNIAAAPKRNDEDAQRLMQLFDFSNRIQLDGEITPVMAWAMIMADEGAWMWGVGDFERVKGELAGKIRCYGFGAVLEEFEVRDAIRNVIDSKAESQAQGGVLEGPFANL